MHMLYVLFAIAAVVLANGGVRGEYTSGVDVEYPCGGSVVVELPSAVRVQSTVKATDVLPLLTRAVHRLNDIKNIYASQRLRSESVVRELRLNTASVIQMLNLNPNHGTAADVRHKVDTILRKLQEELLTQIVHVDHIRRNEHYWAGYHPRELAFRQTTYAQEVAEVEGNVLMPIACSLQQITTSRGVSPDARAIQRIKAIQYSYPLSQYLSDMRAYTVFNSLRKLIRQSRAFFNVLRKAELL